jgi:4-diphosphocytidyl-2-C-methyl-D-erythritol kinase
VPMCLGARPLLALGIGDILQEARVPPLHLVAANPGVAVSTPEVFKALARRDNLPLPPLPHDIAMPGFIEWLSSTRNDLLPPAMALCPTIGDVLIALIETQPLMVRMTGSGATCFAVFSGKDAADAAARAVAAAHPGWWVAAIETGGRTEGA